MRIINIFIISEDIAMGITILGIKPCIVICSSNYFSFFCVLGFCSTTVCSKRKTENHYYFALYNFKILIILL